MQLTKQFACMTLALIGTISSASGQELTLYGKASALRQHSKIELNVSAQEIFRNNFRKQYYFGAFAASPDGPMHFVSQYNDIQSAYADALRLCQAGVQSGQRDCVIYASIVPKGYREGNGITLSQPTTEFYSQYKKLKQHKAMAITPMISQATGGHDTKKKAVAHVLKRCKAKAKAKTPRGLKIDKCVVIASE